MMIKPFINAKIQNHTVFHRTITRTLIGNENFQSELTEDVGVLLGELT